MLECGMRGPNVKLGALTPGADDYYLGSLPPRAHVVLLAGSRRLLMPARRLVGAGAWVEESLRGAGFSFPGQCVSEKGVNADGY